MIFSYRKPEQDEYFVIGADPAEGNDYCAFVVLSKKKGDIVMIGQTQQESPELGHSLNHIGKYFHKHTGHYPKIAVERNVGTATIYVLKSLNYPNLYRMPDTFVGNSNEESEKYGWVTSTATRPKMLDDLALAVRQQAITIPSKHIIDEMFTFIRNKKTGKPEADIGSHDDLVMATAISWQLYQTEPNRSNRIEYAPPVTYTPRDSVIGI